MAELPAPRAPVDIPDEPAGAVLVGAEVAPPPVVEAEVFSLFVLFSGRRLLVYFRHVFWTLLLCIFSRMLVVFRSVC